MREPFCTKDSLLSDLDNKIKSKGLREDAESGDIMSSEISQIGGLVDGDCRMRGFFLTSGHVP